VLIDGVGAVGELGGEGPALHLLESQSEDALADAAFDQLLGDEESGGARGAVVVDVVDRNSCHADLVQSALTTRAVSVDIAHHLAWPSRNVKRRASQKFPKQMK